MFVRVFTGKMMAHPMWRFTSKIAHIELPSGSDIILNWPTFRIQGVQMGFTGRRLGVFRV